MLNGERDDPRRMELTAKLAFKRVYPFIAQYVVRKYHITAGLCLDIGAGPGSLAIAMAEITSLSVVALDVSHDMMEIARTILQTNNSPVKLCPSLPTYTKCPIRMKCSIS